MKRLAKLGAAVAVSFATALAGVAAPAQAAGDQPPVIVSPTEGSTWEVGDTITFEVDFSNSPVEATTPEGDPDGPVVYRFFLFNDQQTDWVDDNLISTPYIPANEGELASFTYTIPASQSGRTLTFWVTQDLADTYNRVAERTFTVARAATPPPPPPPPVVKKPTPPRNFHSTRGNHYVRVGWWAPRSNGGSAITGYQVKRARTTARNVGASARSATFRGLRNGTRYYFYVRAKNRVGYSGWVRTYGTPKAPPRPRAYSSCAAMHRGIYPHGVGRSGARDRTSGTPVTNFKVSTIGYQMNDGRVVSRNQYDLDRDNDGIACEA